MYRSHPRSSIPPTTKTAICPAKLAASFTVWAGEAILSIDKTVETAHDPAKPGDPITYTLVVRNDGNADAVDVHIWDTLPEGVIGEDVDITTTIATGAAYTITVPATLATDVPLGSISIIRLTMNTPI